jgi:ribosome recycling factor
MTDVTQCNLSMQKSIDFFKTEIASIRTGRAVPALVENIVCNAYGGTTKLTIKELGTIASMDNQTLMIQPWDLSTLGEIRQGILAANIGLTPVVDNNVIRISIPSLTAERRGEYIKLLHRKKEDAKISIRNIRQDFMKEIKLGFENKEISEDDKFKKEEDLQRITDEFVLKIDELSEKKEQEITSL